LDFVAQEKGEEIYFVVHVWIGARVSYPNTQFNEPSIKVKAKEERVMRS